MTTFDFKNDVTVDRKRHEAVYPHWFTKHHRHEDCDNRCLYTDGRGIERCAHWEKIASDVRTCERENHAVHLGCGGEVTLGFCHACDTQVLGSAVIKP